MDNENSIDSRLMAIVVAIFAIITSCFLCAMGFLQIYGIFSFEFHRVLTEEQQAGLKVLFALAGILFGFFLVSIAGILKAAASAPSPASKPNPFAQMIEEETGSPFVPDL